MDVNRYATHRQGKYEAAAPVTHPPPPYCPYLRDPQHAQGFVNTAGPKEATQTAKDRYVMALSTGVMEADAVMDELVAAHFGFGPLEALQQPSAATTETAERAKCLCLTTP